MRFNAVNYIRTNRKGQYLTRFSCFPHYGILQAVIMLARLEKDDQSLNSCNFLASLRETRKSVLALALALHLCSHVGCHQFAWMQASPSDQSCKSVPNR